MDGLGNPENTFYGSKIQSPTTGTQPPATIFTIRSPTQYPTTQKWGWNMDSANSLRKTHSPESR